ncbi:MAG: hypothetical protein KKB30_04320 [Proteobacteria bacterium]|nr:hypothetical protein [Pseudomonadota bacterium]MBU1716453.1 hypothetical protein [Pseudomonadota bacterium]
MNKKLLVLAMALAFTLSTVAAIAATTNCTVTAIDGDTVTLDCKKADDLKVGQKVKVKEAKKKGVEGC